MFNNVRKMAVISLVLCTGILSACTAKETKESKTETSAQVSAAVENEDKKTTAADETKTEEKDEAQKEQEPTGEQPNKAASEEEKGEEAKQENPIIEIVMEDGRTIRAELYPEAAPITVENFLKLVNDQFYDGLTFHRIVKDFVIQGGDPNGDGTGGPGWTIKGEFTQNGVDNPIKHDRGVLSMARSQSFDSAGSQFFICVDAATVSILDDAYAAFGKVIDEESMSVVDEIVSKPIVGDVNNPNDVSMGVPANPEKIKTIRVVSAEKE